MEKGISYEQIASTQMMNMGDRFCSNDYFKAKYKNINFESSDVHIQEEHTDSDGDTIYVTIFRGQWFVFDFNKPFKANIQVCAKNFSNARRGSLFSKTKYNKVDMEDIEFNKEFRVYAQNELDAFYVLTKMMDVVKACAKHEKETLFEVINLRKGMSLEEKNVENVKMLKN